MKRKNLKYEIKEGTNGNWFIKNGNEVIAGFKLKEHADKFYSLILGKSDEGGALKAPGLFDQIQKSGQPGIE